jgi:hypothetical protein
MTGFLPSRNGFHFSNSQWPSVPDWTFSILGITVPIGDASNGMCGGMAYAARDLFQAGLRPPPDTTPPSSGPLFNYIAGRLLDSFDLPFGWTEYLALMNPALPDHETLIEPLGHGRAWIMINQYWPLIKADLDNGIPSPLGLVEVKSVNPMDLGKNHQVLAYGYQLNGTSLAMSVYDPNHPDDDNVTMVLDIGNPAHTTPVTYSDGSTIWCFFRTNYVFKDPSSITADGHLWHTMRRPDGSWTGLGDVNGQFAIPGPVQAVSAAWDGQTGETQFLFTTQDGHLWHTMRRPDGSWTGLGDVNGQFAIPGPVQAVSATWDGETGETQFMFTTQDGHLWHTMRRPDGSWTGLGDVNGQFAIPGPVQAVSATWDGETGETQFMFTTQDGHLWHTMRRPDGSWTGLGDVNGLFAIPGPVRSVSATWDGTPGETQFMFTTQDGHLWHTMRRPDGSWTGLGDVNGQFAIPGPVQAVSATWDGESGETQFVFSTQDGHMWHTMRRPNGSWTGLGDVNGQFAIPGPVHSVSAAWDGTPGETQFMFTTEDGHSWHTMRRPDGSWTGLGDVNGQFAIPGPVHSVSATFDGTSGETQFMFDT